MPNAYYASVQVYKITHNHPNQMFKNIHIKFLKTLKTLKRNKNRNQLQTCTKTLPAL